MAETTNADVQTRPLANTPTQPPAVGAQGEGTPGNTRQVFYRFEDEAGNLHITDSLAELPPEIREKAKPVALQTPAAAARTDQAHSEMTDSSSVMGVTIHWPSVALGCGVVTVLWGLFALSKGRSRGRLVGALGFVGFIVLGVGLYLGALRRMAGKDDKDAPLLSSPTQIIDDAKQTVQQVKERRKARDDLLKQIQAESR